MAPVIESYSCGSVVKFSRNARKTTKTCKIYLHKKYSTLPWHKNGVIMTLNRNISCYSYRRFDNFKRNVKLLPLLPIKMKYVPSYFTEILTKYRILLSLFTNNSKCFWCSNYVSENKMCLLLWKNKVMFG